MSRDRIRHDPGTKIMQHDRERTALQPGHEARFGDLFMQPLRDGAQELVATRLPMPGLQEVEVRNLEQEHGDRPLAALGCR
jgi:hypothetical protein